MSLRELTANKHTEAENTQFMKCVFAKNMPPDIWSDFLFQKWIFYSVIEQRAQDYGLLSDLPDICRTNLLRDDLLNMVQVGHDLKVLPTTKQYCEYLKQLTDSDSILAHLYTWHMGDMYGGQMISKIVSAQQNHLIFQNRAELIEKLRMKLHDNLASEANVAFDWAIKIMNSYEF